MKLIKNLNDGKIYQTNFGAFMFKDVDGMSDPYESEKTCIEEYYIKQARDHYGAAIRDNSREDKISLGKEVDEGYEEV